MADPADWQDPPWYPDDADPYDWRWFVAEDVKVEWLNLTDEQKWEIAVAAQRLGELQRRIVEGMP